ncbi:DNA-directed RNA polymerase, partial [Nanoarchaeota archaeon]
MYRILKLRDRVRVPPELFGEDVREAVEEAIRKEYEGHLSSKHGYFLKLLSVDEVSDGIILPGDGAVFYDVV